MGLWDESTNCLNYDCTKIQNALVVTILSFVCGTCVIYDTETQNGIHSTGWCEGPQPPTSNVFVEYPPWVPGTRIHFFLQVSEFWPFFASFRFPSELLAV